MDKKWLFIFLLSNFLCLNDARKVVGKINSKKNDDDLSGDFEDGTDEKLNEFLTNKILNGLSSDDTESSGDDDDDLSGSGSGEGSGVNDFFSVESTHKPKGTTKSVEDITVVTSTTMKPADLSTGPIGNTVEDGTTSMPNVAGNKPGKQVKNDDDDKGINFTMGIIIGVVVGAVLAILVIIFLVYRLRKKDEGSYSLDEQSTQAFIADGPQKGEKEVFA